MSGWSDDELDRIGTASQLQIGTIRDDGSFRSFVPIWVVRVGDNLYIRSYRGRGGTWYRHAMQHPQALIRAGGIERHVTLAAQTETVDPSTIDAAYRNKYGQNQYADAMVTPSAAETTLTMHPAN